MNSPRGAFLKAMELLEEINFACEVGVREGKNALAMLQGGVKRLVLVDSYPECEEHWLEANGTVKITREMQDGFKATMLRNVAPFMNRIAYVDKASTEAAKGCRDGAFDFVYIDADHWYENIKADIEAWYPKVRGGGVLAGHDFAKKGYEGVVKAVNEFAEANGLKVIACENSDWMVVKP